MRRLWILFTLISCIFLDRTETLAQSNPVDEIIQRINALRVSYGVPAYEVDYALMYAAQTQASWSAENNHFGHDGPGGSSPNDRAQAAGYGGGEESYAIENVAFGTASLNTPELVVTMWQNDAGHLNAMISADYQHIGVGYAEANGFSWYVMMVGRVGGTAWSGDTEVQEIPQGVTSSNPFVLSEPDEFGAIYHEVQTGQTAWTIAAQYRIELTELFALNNLTEESVLHPGDVLMIREPDLPTSTPTFQAPTHRPPHTTTAMQTTAVLIDSNTRLTQTASVFAAQNAHDFPGNSSGSNLSSIMLFVGLGMILVAIILIARILLY